MKSITVFVITYNQEDVISRTLDSILIQKGWGLHEIIIGDDASTDNTYGILCQYKKKYPEYIRIIRNEKNMGIYQNLANIIANRGESDFYTSCAGDDSFCEGYFEAFQKLAVEKNIDANHKVGVFSDWITVTPKGVEKVFKQDLCLTDYNLWSLYIRGKISTRSLLIARPIIDAIGEVDMSHGLLFAESVYDSKRIRLIEEKYYLPQATSRYYAGIGVSTKLNPRKSDYYTRQWTFKWEYYQNTFINNPHDSNYAKYELGKADFYERPTLYKYLKTYFYYIKGQLPHCHNSIKSDFWRFGAMFKYLLKYCGKEVDYNMNEKS